MNIFFRIRYPAVVFCAAAFVFQGCGTGEYERRLEVGLDQLQEKAAYNNLYAPMTLDGTSVSVRVPACFTVAYNKDSEEDKRRVMPSDLDLPGLLATYEAFFEDGKGGEISYYVYLAVVSGEDAKALRFDEKVRKPANPNLMSESGKLYQDISRALESGSVSKWKDYQAKGMDGGTVSWQQVETTGLQPFYTVAADGRQSYDKVEAAFDLYAKQIGKGLVMIAWRVPRKIELQVQASELSQLMLGTVKLDDGSEK